MTNNNAKELDQFFTTSTAANNIFKNIEKILIDLHGANIVFVEPSAGSGTWIDTVSNNDYPVTGYDIDPQREDIIKQDYLTLELPSDPHRVIIGNPPFGKRARLAIDFVNKSLEHSNTVAFIVPMQFVKYLTQKQVKEKARLVYNEVLPDDSFTFCGKAYKVRSVFQIWTLLDHDDYPDERIIVKPPIVHKDFVMKQYNCCKEYEYYLREDWDCAVLRQGWSDMVPLEKGSVLDPRKQWLLFYTEDDKVLENIKNIDFNQLGLRNTSVKGFGKADVVAEYSRLYD